MGCLCLRLGKLSPLARLTRRSTRLPEVPAVFFAHGYLVSLVSCQLDCLTFTLAIPASVEPFSFVLGVLLIRANHQVVRAYTGSVAARYGSGYTLDVLRQAMEKAW